MPSNKLSKASYVIAQENNIVKIYSPDNSTGTVIVVKDERGKFTGFSRLREDFETSGARINYEHCGRGISLFEWQSRGGKK